MEKKMKSDSHKKMTQKYSTWGDKLLQHTDVLNSIQNNKKFKPITYNWHPWRHVIAIVPFVLLRRAQLKIICLLTKLRRYYWISKSWELKVWK